MSVSLHRHIRGAYNFDSFSQGFVEILAAQQTLAMESEKYWFEGTADAVRKNLRYISQPDMEYVLILSGDQLYRMDFREMIGTHLEAGADVTIAAKPVTRIDASSLGIMRVDRSGRVLGFLEKPKNPRELDDMAIDPAWIAAQGVSSNGRDYLASMGIYLFSRQALLDVLEKTSYPDFGKDVFPAAIRTRHAQVHLFDGYWEDIGTIGAFYKANLELAGPHPPLALASANAPLYTRPRFLPPTRAEGASIHNSLVAEGCFIEKGTVIENSIIGLRCHIGQGVAIRNSIVMGADYYDTSDKQLSTGGIPLGIGEESVVERAIVDKNCRIGPRAEVVHDSRAEKLTISDYCQVRDGILVVSKDACLPAGWRASAG
jgi:glucose-1-phosphate adenylyltransferase